MNANPLKWYFFTASSHFIYPTSDLSFFFFHRLMVKFDPIVAAFWIVKPGQLKYSDISRYINGLFNYDTVKLDFIKKYLWVLSRYVLPSIVYKCLSVENINWNVLILWRTVIGCQNVNQLIGWYWARCRENLSKFFQFQKYSPSSTDPASIHL